MGQGELPSSSSTKLLEILIYIPLAITQAAAFINRNQISLSKYLTALEENEQNRISYSTNDSYLSTSDDSLDSDYGESSALSPAPSLIIDDLPHLPSVSDDQLDDGPTPPAML